MAGKGQLVAPEVTENRPKKRSVGTYKLVVNDDDSVNDATGTKFEELSSHLVVQTAMASFSEVKVKDEELERQMEVVYGALQGIGPRDELEGMLAAQMVGVHNLAMTMMSGAHRTGMSLEQITQKVNRVAKLSHLFIAQIEALNRYRGKGQQKMTVEHVTVNHGGQAIVGVVEGGEKPENGQN